MFAHTCITSYIIQLCVFLLQFAERFKELKEAVRLARDKSQDKMELSTAALSIAAPQVWHCLLCIHIQYINRLCRWYFLPCILNLVTFSVQLIAKTARKYPQNASNCFEKPEQPYKSDEHLFNHITLPRH